MMSDNNTFIRMFKVLSPELSTIAIGIIEPVDTLNPIKSEDKGPADILEFIFRGLVQRNLKDGKIISDIASNWKKDPGQAIYRFYLPDNCMDHISHRLNAEDVVFTYKTLLDPKINSPHYTFLSEYIENIKQVDDLTVMFELKKKVNDHIFYKIFSNFILPKNYIDKYGWSEFDRKPIGHGPFTFSEILKIPNKRVILKCHSRYFKGSPKSSQIIINQLKTYKLLGNELKKGMIHIGIVPYNEDFYVEFKDDVNFVVYDIESIPKLKRTLHIQTKKLRGRTPNIYNTNWNVEDWFLEV